eukprot:7901137-Pyramimonas_sp.AAC.1
MFFCLYGSAAWTFTQELIDRVRRVQRKMPRMVLGSRRRQSVKEGISRSASSSASESDSFSGEDPDLEPRVDWPRRTARELEVRRREVQVRDGIENHQQAASN